MTKRDNEWEKIGPDDYSTIMAEYARLNRLELVKLNKKTNSLNTKLDIIQFGLKDLDRVNDPLNSINNRDWGYSAGSWIDWPILHSRRYIDYMFIFG